MKGKKPYFDFETIVNLIPENVYWFDINNVFQGCNYQQAMAIGLNSPDDIIGKTVYDFQSKEDGDKIISNNLMVMRTNQSMVFEETSLLVGNKKGIFISRKIPILSSAGFVVGLLGVSFNISSCLEDEALRKSLLARAMGQVEV
jgi:two-component system aerobic respiration control sensor histidine kinase ArcB